MSTEIINTFKKVVFYYTKEVKPSDRESYNILDSTSFTYCNHPADIDIFIANKINSLKFVGCDVFQYAIYDVSEKLINAYEIKGVEQIEIL